MDKLQFENFEITSDGKIVRSSLDGSSAVKQNEISQEQAVNLSSKIITALTEKAKEHNLNNSSQKVTVNQLKKVYRHGINLKQETESNINYWAMARINMFLRMKSGENLLPSINIASIKNISQLIDVSEGLAPSEKDFELANKDIEKYDLLSFNSVEELYLEDYEPFKLDWS